MPAKRTPPIDKNRNQPLPKLPNQSGGSRPFTLPIHCHFEQESRCIVFRCLAFVGKLVPKTISILQGLSSSQNLKCRPLTGLWCSLCFYAAGTFLDSGLLAAQVSPRAGLSFQQLTDSTVLYFLKVRDYEKAIGFAIPRRDSIRVKQGANSLDYANACRSLGEMLARCIRYEEAKKSFRLALSLADSLLPARDGRRATYYSTYAYYLKQIGSYQSAASFYRRALAVHALTSRRDSLLLADMELHLGQICFFNNQADEAETRLKHSLWLYQNLLGSANEDVAVAWYYLSEFYFRLGNFSKSASSAGAGLQSLEGLEGSSALLWKGELKMQLGKVYEQQHRYSDAVRCFLESLDALNRTKSPNESMSQETRKKQSELLKGLGAIDFLLHDLARAENRFRSALQAVEEMMPEKHQEVQELRLNLASVLSRLERYREADSLLALVRPRMEENMGKASAQLNFLSQEEIMLALKRGRREEAMHGLDSLEGYIRRQLDAIFLNFSATENEAFLQSLEKYRGWISGLLAAETERAPALAARLLDVHLGMHGILLSSEKSVLQALRQKNEPELAQKVENWFALRNEFARLQAGGNASADSLSAFEEKVNSLEKELIRLRRLKASRVNFTRPSAEIQKVLTEGQAAIQIIRVAMPGMVVHEDRSDSLRRPYVYPEITDTIHYLALIIRPGNTRVERVVLRKGNLLEKQGMASYRNRMRWEETDRFTYGLFWQAIDSALGKDVKEVFYSPDGMFHMLNPASVLIPVQNRYMGESRKWVRLTRLQDLLEPAPAKQPAREAVLVGAPSFSPAGYRINAADSVSVRFDSLPGTQVEIDLIAKNLRAKGWKVKRFSGSRATEEAIKEIRKPEVLHLATHGFFREDSLGGSHALLNSGLILARRDSIQTGSRPEDGVLKAREALTMNLENTRLVVLSACETGLGTSMEGEGLYGLQRAFQIAGAHNILMSLWKVDDDATGRLMAAFYRHYLQMGDANESLRKAQMEIKKNYPHPYFWASFLVLGR